MPPKHASFRSLACQAFRANLEEKVHRIRHGGVHVAGKGPLVFVRALCTDREWIGRFAKEAPTRPEQVLDSGAHCNMHSNQTAKGTKRCLQRSLPKPPRTGQRIS